MKKKLVSFFTVATLLFTTPMAFAANGDIWKKSPEGLYKTAREMTKDKVARREVTKARANYYFEVDGHLFTYDQADQAYQKDNENFMATLKPADAVKPVPAAELAVASVSAINSTRIEVTFNQKPKTEPQVKDFSIEGLEIKSVNAKAGSEVVFEVSTSLQESGKEYTLTFNEQKYTFKALVEVAKLDSPKLNFAEQVGKNVTVTYKVLDQNGNPLSGVEVYVRAGNFTSSVAQPPIEKKMNSNEQGVVEFSYSRSERMTDELVAYVVNQPLVRNEDVKVEWVTSPTGLLTVVSNKEGKIGHNTVVEFEVTAKDKDGVALEKGETILLTLKSVPTTLPAGVAPKVQIQKTNGTWADVAGGPDFDFELLTAGSAKLRVYYSLPTDLKDLEKSFEVTPSFQYDLNGDSTYDDKDPIAISPRLIFEKQVPQITITPKNNQNMVSTKAGSAKEYTLKVTDQFGNPFRGTIKTGALEILDGLSSTPVPTGAFQISADSNKDKVFEKVNASNLELNFAFGKDDLDEDGEVEIKVSSAIAGNQLTFVAFFDTDGNGFVGEKDPKAVAERILFGPVGPVTIKVTPETQTIAASGDATFEVEFLDADNKPVKPESSISFGLYDLKAKALISLAQANVTMNNEKGVALVAGTDFVTLGDSTELKPEEASGVELTVKNAAFTGKEEVQLWVFSENGAADGVHQLDELITKADFTLETAQASGAKLTLKTVQKGGGTAVGFAKNDNFDYAEKANTDMEFTYTLTDQSGDDFANPGTAVIKVIWTVTNNTSEDLTVTGVANTGTITPATANIEKGQSVTFTTEIAATEAVTDIKFKAAADAEGDLLIQAQTNVNGTMAQKKVLILPAAKYHSGAATMNVIAGGTVVAFNDNADATNTAVNNATDGTYFVLNTALGNVLFKVDAASTAKYFMNGNTDTEKHFEEILQAGTSVNVKGDGAKTDINY